MFGAACRGTTLDPAFKQVFAKHMANRGIRAAALGISGERTPLATDRLALL